MAICLSHLILFSSKARKTFKLGVSDEFFACEKYMIFSNKKIMIYNGNRTDWSPIRSVIIRVINKIGRTRSGSPIC